jgi:hypothetical protein
MISYRDDTYTRASKRTARNYFEKGFPIRLAGSNINPSNYYGVCVADIHKTEEEPDFDKLVNAFEIYNCINSETGKTASYYLENKYVPKRHAD